MLIATSIEKRFSTMKVLESVGLHLRTSEIHALINQNNAGKSTLI